MRVPKRFFGARDFETGSLEFKALKMAVRFGIESLKGLLGTLYYTTVNQKAFHNFIVLGEQRENKSARNTT